MSTRALVDGSVRATLLPTTTIGAPVGPIATTPIVGVTPCQYLTAQAIFVFGAGGTNVTVYIQTSLDKGASWIDVISFQFLVTTATKVSAVSTYTALAAAITPTDGTLAVNTILSGLLGDRVRAKYVTTGTYTGTTTLAVDIVTKG